MKRHSLGTGGGPPCNISLTEVQSDPIEQISENAITEHKKSQESIVEFTLDNNTTKFVVTSQLDENIEIIIANDSDREYF